MICSRERNVRNCSGPGIDGFELLKTMNDGSGLQDGLRHFARKSSAVKGFVNEAVLVIAGVACEKVFGFPDSGFVV